MASGEGSATAAAEGGGEEESVYMCDGFLHKLSGLINKDNVNLVLSEQEAM